MNKRKSTFVKGMDIIIDDIIIDFDLETKRKREVYEKN